jgi:hypothetical protein
MAIKYKRNCVTCQKCKGNGKLRSRIYNAYFKRGEWADESIPQICKEIGVGEASMYNHLKKHVTELKRNQPVIVERHIEQMKATIAKETELALDHDAAVPQEDYERAVSGVIAEGMAQMKTAGKTITISQLLTAAKIKADYMSKKRGQNVEIIKTMYKMSSGNTKADEPTGVDVV